MNRPILLFGIAAAGALAPLVVSNSVADHYCYTQWEDLSMIDNAPYDGRFTFFRVRFEPIGGGDGGRGFGRRGTDKKWDHDTPRAERHFMKILEELTTLRPKMDCGAIYAFGDPESFKYPIAYVSEPGYWTQTEEEVKGIQEFVKKGGFIIFDDFDARMWYNFEEQWRRAFPDLEIKQLEKSHPIFDAFFDLRETPLHDTYGPPQWLGVYEDNDPSKRLIAVIDYNSDLGELMEFSDEGFVPLTFSNDAYKIMTNYVIYALTH
jgi:hypothetical protein